MDVKAYLSFLWDVFLSVLPAVSWYVCPHIFSGWFAFAGIPLLLISHEIHFGEKT